MVQAVSFSGNTDKIVRRSHNLFCISGAVGSAVAAPRGSGCASHPHTGPRSRTHLTTYLPQTTPYNPLSPPCRPKSGGRAVGPGRAALWRRFPLAAIRAGRRRAALTRCQRRAAEVMAGGLPLPPPRLFGAAGLGREGVNRSLGDCG